MARLTPRIVLLLAALAHTAYVVRVGGDFVHYRYLAFPVLVMVASLGGIVEQFLGPASRARTWAVSGAGVLFFGLIVSAYPSAQLPAHPLRLQPEGDSLAQYRADGVEDAASHRFRFDLRAEAWDHFPDVEELLRGGHLRYRWIIASGWCREAYAHLDWFVVQSFGLTDPVLAHVTLPPLSLQAGHRWEFVSMAEDLARARLEMFEGHAETGETVFRRAVRRRHARHWMVRNVDALDAIEQRTHRERAFWPGILEAFEPWPGIVVSTKDLAKPKPKRKRKRASRR
jgi:hypothetical protein